MLSTPLVTQRTVLRKMTNNIRERPEKKSTGSKTKEMHLFSYHFLPVGQEPQKSFLSYHALPVS